MEENLNQNEASMQSNMPHKKSVGPVIGIAIIVVIIIFGGLYYWGGKINDQEQRQQQENTTAEEILDQQDASLESLQAQSASDAIADIETDLNLTDLDSLDTELNNIDIELGL